MKLLYSGKNYRGLNFAIFAILLNSLNFHFAKCSPLKRYKADSEQKCETLILNETGK